MELLRVRKGTEVQLGKNMTLHAPPTNLALMPRQWTILNATRKGRANFEIAIELGFSESLIRQETVQIYRKLGVSGRKEILDADLKMEDRFANFQSFPS